MVESPFWLGYSSDSWGTSWGYDEEGNPIEVEGGAGGGGRSGKKRSKEPVRLTQEKDLMEMLTIVLTTGVLNGTR